jgi:hypothetical protein
MLRIDHGMDDSEATSLEQVRAFLAGSGELRFAGRCGAETYAWMRLITFGDGQVPVLERKARRLRACDSIVCRIFPNRTSSPCRIRVKSIIYSAFLDESGATHC